MALAEALTSPASNHERAQKAAFLRRKVRRDVKPYARILVLGPAEMGFAPPRPAAAKRCKNPCLEPRSESCVHTRAEASGGGKRSDYYSWLCSAVITTVFTMSSTVQPRERSFTGLARPHRAPAAVVAPERRHRCDAHRRAGGLVAVALTNPSSNPETRTPSRGPRPPSRTPCT